jgi:hypothetical protein
MLKRKTTYVAVSRLYIGGPSVSRTQYQRIMSTSERLNGVEGKSKNHNIFLSSIDFNIPTTEPDTELTHRNFAVR